MLAAFGIAKAPGRQRPESGCPGNRAPRLTAPDGEDLLNGHEARARQPGPERRPDRHPADRAPGRKQPALTVHSAPLRRPRSRWVVATVMASMTLGVLPIFLLGAFSPDIQEALHLSEVAIGAIFGLYFAVSVLVSFAAGQLGERRGAAWTMSVAAAGVAAALVGIGLSRTAFHLALAVLIGGVANTLTQPAGNLALARALPPSRLGLAFALKQSSIPVASMIGGLAVPTVGLLLGWRWTIALCAVLGLVVLVMARVLAPRAGRASLVGDDRPGGSLRRLVPLTAAGVCGATATTGMIAFFVDGAVRAGVSKSGAGIWFAAAGVLGIGGRLLAGWMADGWRRHPPLVLCLAVYFACGTVGFALLAFASSWWLRVPATLLIFAGGWGWQGMFHHATVLWSQPTPSRGTGMTQTGLSLGGSIGPVIFGAIAGSVSFRAAWLFTAGLMAAAAVFVSLSPRVGQPVVAETGVEP
jgi:MFS family permease